MSGAHPCSNVNLTSVMWCESKRSMVNVMMSYLKQSLIIFRRLR